MLPLAIFKTGRHTAVNGKVIEFTGAQLKACADVYSPQLHEAPLVVGHPTMDAPAYGWAKALSFAGDVLNAEPHQVDEQFAAMVNAGRFKKISASFYEPHAPANPVPGVYYLRHVGFLGAQAPSVRGLRNASFAAAEQGIVDFAGRGDNNSVSFAAPRGWTVDPVQLDLHNEALAYQTAHPGTDYIAAVLAVSRAD